MKVLKFFTALFMSVIVPFSNFFASLGRPAKGSFTELETIAKTERSEDMFETGENDIVLYGSGLEEAIEKIKSDGCENEISVWLHGGEYIIDRTVKIDGMKNVIFRAFPGEKVSITTGKKIGNWKETEVNGVKAWVADAPENIEFNSLFKGDEKLSLSRYPENGYLFVKGPDRSVALFNEETTPWKGYSYGDTAFFTKDDIKLESFHNVTDVQIKLMHYWFCENTTLTSFDNGRISVKRPCSMKVEENDRYLLENVFETLNNPGEWYHDKESGKIYYIPQENDDINATVLTAASENMYFDISDSSNITFKNITVKNSDWCYLECDPSVGWLGTYDLLFPQGNLECNGVFDITKSQGINFINCDFLNIGNGAIRFHKEVKNCTVTGCTFREIGGNAVFIDGYNTSDRNLMTENVDVVDNLIEGYGRNFPSGIGIILTHAQNCRLSHNEIHDGYYTAISCGWVWGYTEHTTDGIEISDNHIYDIGQGWLSDMGGIYTLGIQPNTVLTHNKIHNVAADPNEGGYGGWGIYLDEGSSNITVYQNLVYDCGSNSFHQHYGQDNIIKNNIFALSTEGQFRVSRLEEHNELHLMNNIIVSDNTPIYTNTVESKFTDSKNLYWDFTNGKNVISSSGEDMKFKDRLYKLVMQAMGYYNGGVYADPMFRDAKNFDFTLSDDSPALTEIGFKTWNYNTAGTLTDFSE